MIQLIQMSEGYSRLLRYFRQKVKELQYMAGGMVVFLETENENKLLAEGTKYMN